MLGRHLEIQDPLHRHVIFDPETLQRSREAVPRAEAIHLFYEEPFSHTLLDDVKER